MWHFRGRRKTSVWQECVLLSDGGKITLTKMEIILKNSFALSNVVVKFLEISSCLTCK
jgi:hypothetical protein